MKLKEIRKRAIFELEQSGIKSAALDVDILLKEIIEKDETYLFSHPDLPLTNSQYQKFRRFVRKRKTGYPIAYLTGHKEFYGVDFKVNKNTLIPRPETEELVEIAVKYLDKDLQTANCQPRTIIDIGTGCGNIIISLSKNLSFRLPPSTFKLFASDISERALSVAKLNAKSHSSTIKFYKSDLFTNKRMPKYYDLILSNLPYVPKKIVKPNEEISYEPQNAIFAEDNGSKIIKNFIDQAKTKLNKNGMILLEGDPRNIQDLRSYALKNFDNAEIIKDLSGRDRFLKVLHN